MCLVIKLLYPHVTSSGEVSILPQEGRVWGGKSPLIGQEFKMVDGKQPSDWTIIQDGRWNRTRLNKMKFSDWPKSKFKFSLI